MNQVIDPSFELDSPAWKFSPTPPQLAERTQTEAFDGSWSAILRYDVDAFDPFGYVHQTFTPPLISGQSYPVELYVKNIDASLGGLVCYLEDGVGGITPVGALLVPVGNPGWYRWSPGSFVAGPTTVGIRFQNQGSKTDWYVDAIAVGALSAEEIMARHRHLIIAELVNVLRGIRGPEYWTDLGGRVYTRLRAPEELADGEFPALFVVEIGPASIVRNDEHGLRPAIRAAVVGFVRETAEDVKVSTASPAASKLRDDVIRALLYNISLNGLISPLIINEEEMEVGVDQRYGKMYVGVTMPYHLFKENLGPQAI